MVKYKNYFHAFDKEVTYKVIFAINLNLKNRDLFLHILKSICSHRFYKKFTKFLKKYVVIKDTTQCSPSLNVLNSE